MFHEQADCLAAIAFSDLHIRGVHGIILDLDNTIVSEDDRYLSPGAEDWIRTAQLKGFRLFILSNGRRRDRAKYWAERLGVSAISSARKPFPMSFRKALSHMQLRGFQVVVIGDSRHTDVLGAFFIQASSIQVATLPHPFRWWERLLGKRVQIPYPAHLERLRFF